MWRDKRDTHTPQWAVKSMAEIGAGGPNCIRKESWKPGGYSTTFSIYGNGPSPRQLYLTSPFGMMSALRACSGYKQVVIRWQAGIME